MTRIKIAGIVRVVALMLIVGFGWGLVRDRLSLENWQVPLEYRGDAPQILGRIKAASEGDYIPFGSATITRLGAPYQADWNDFPMYEKILIFGLGTVAKVIGLFPASNFGELLGHLLSAVSFYLCCRFLRYSKVWSFVGAALFSFTYYHFFRNLGHLLLAYSYALPWAILSCWIIVASKRIRLGDRLSWVCLITALVMGLSNPYNLNVYVQLLCFSLLVQYVRQRRRENLQVGLLMVAVIGVAFIAVNFGTFYYNWVHGKNPGSVDRNYFESELYALKPMEFFIPPATHNVPFLAEIGKKYVSSVYVRGEIDSPYLGIVGIAGLLWLFAESFLLLNRNRKRSKPFPPYALQATWVIFYSVIGGVNCLIALGGIQYFRASNRYSIFVSTIIMLFLVSRLSRWSRRWPAGANLGLASLVLVFGMFDEMPRPLSPSETIQGRKAVESDRAYASKIEAAVPPRSMVFQLPVMNFPEGLPIHDMLGYEPIRPYFFTKTLRFSFGAVKGRTREAWQFEVEKMPAAEMISTLEKYGFAAISINRRGYADHGEELLKQIAATGRTIISEDDPHENVSIRLQPSATPELPHTDDRAQILYRSGWSVKQHNALESQEWSSGDATLSFFSEAKQPTSYTIKGVVGSIAQRHVTMEMDGRQIWSSEVGAGQGVPVDIIVTGRHGNNKIYLRTDAEPSHPNDTSPPMAFTLVNLQITKMP